MSDGAVSCTRVKKRVAPSCAHNAYDLATADIHESSDIWIFFVSLPANQVGDRIAKRQKTMNCFGGEYSTQEWHRHHKKLVCTAVMSGNVCRLFVGVYDVWGYRLEPSPPVAGGWLRSTFWEMFIFFWNEMSAATHCILFTFSFYWFLFSTVAPPREGGREGGREREWDRETETESWSDASRQAAGIFVDIHWNTHLLDSTIFFLGGPVNQRRRHVEQDCANAANCIDPFCFDASSIWTH